MESPALTLKTPPAPAALSEAAERFGTPAFVYDESVLRRQCQTLREALAGLPTRLLYAMKANPSPAVLRVIQSEGFGLDIVSPGELALASQMGFAPGEMLFSANNMTDAEMHRAAEHGVLLNVGELSRLERFGAAHPGRPVCLRLNPQVEAGHHEHVITAGPLSKFGLPLDQIEEARALVEAHDLHVVGLHQHIGSGILKPRRFGEAVRVLLEAAHRFPRLEFLNFGGGLGIPYHAEETPFFGNGDFHEAVVRPLQDFQHEYEGAHPGASGLTFWFEPGRFLVAEAGTLLARVNTIKRTNERTFAGTDSGMAHLLRPALYDSYHAISNLSNPGGPLRSYDVVGNICETGDVFARDRSVQEIREGDLLALLDAGAYGMAMASTYNLRPRPAEVMRRPDGTLELVRPRRSPEELAAQLLA